MTEILWKIIRFITANLGIILIGLGVTAVCFAFIMDGAIDHLPDIDESAKSSAERYIDENRDVIREEVMQYIEQEQDVDLDTMINEMDVEQMKIVCTVDPKSLDGVSLDFCRDIEGKSEKEIKDMLLEKQIDLGINQIVTQTSNISDSIEYGIKEKFNVTLDEVSDKYVSAFKWIGVFMIIVGSAFIFVSRKFAVYPSLYSIAVNLTINVGMCSAMLWFIRNVSPGTMVDTIQKMSANNSEFSPI
ncbi:MAG: hypothetical protein KAR20_08680, partial [Candidatus Heimdallarchaeota archaeon]|nr:hypothetical protein [Candidatus Heimdallarchaeota archaeon]